MGNDFSVFLLFPLNYLWKFYKNESLFQNNSFEQFTINYDWKLILIFVILLRIFSKIITTNKAYIFWYLIELVNNRK